MLKGGQLKDSWKPFEGKIPDGTRIMMIGAAEVVAAPVKQTVWVEDLPPEQQVNIQFIFVKLTFEGNTRFSSRSYKSW